MIGWIFVDIARLDLDAHVPVVASFWETVLLGGGSYRGGTFAPHAAIHARIGLRPGHFRQWLELWSLTVDELFAGERAETAKAHAQRVARAFERRLAALPAPGDPAPAALGLEVTVHGASAAGGRSPSG
jgi:hemoglobin